MTDKKISAVGNAIPSAEEEKINISTASITLVDENCKCELTEVQKKIVVSIYRKSKNCAELISKIRELKICDINTALDALVEAGYFSGEDKLKFLESLRGVEKCQ